jgi:general stress protein YciG
MNDAVKKYLAEIGKKGGSVTSKTKAETARKNGKKGGRPLKKGAK